jgi:hypothetical protein
MNNSANGIFDFQQMNVIRDSHRDWCAGQSIDPDSPVGREAAAIMFETYRSGKTSPEDMLAACDDYVRQRQEHVRLGTPPIESRS